MFRKDGRRPAGWAAGLPQLTKVGRVAGGPIEKRRRPVLRVGRSAAALKRYRHAGMMKFEEASDDDLWYDMDWGRRRYDGYMRSIHEK